MRYVFNNILNYANSPFLDFNVTKYIDPYNKAYLFYNHFK